MRSGQADSQGPNRRWRGWRSRRRNWILGGRARFRTYFRLGCEIYGNDTKFLEPFEKHVVLDRVDSFYRSIRCPLSWHLVERRHSWKQNSQDRSIWKIRSSSGSGWKQRREEAVLVVLAAVFSVAGLGDDKEQWQNRECITNACARHCSSLSGPTNVLLLLVDMYNIGFS